MLPDRDRCPTRLRPCTHTFSYPTQTRPEQETRLQVQPLLYLQSNSRHFSEVLDLMSMSVEHPHRIDEYRKYSAIYGRFDAKRRLDKGLSVHEVMVNEAAAQLCILMPALLTRRDDLFSLSRRVVSEAGLTTRKRRPTSSSPAPSPRGEQTAPSPVEEKKKKTVRPLFFTVTIHLGVQRLRQLGSVALPTAVSLQSCSSLASGPRPPPPFCDPHPSHPLLFRASVPLCSKPSRICILPAQGPVS